MDGEMAYDNGNGINVLFLEQELLDQPSQVFALLLSGE